MLTTFTATLTPMLMMFSCILIGYILNKTKTIPKGSQNILSRLETYAIIPALTISSFSKYCSIATLQQQMQLVIYSLIAVAVAITIATPLSALFERKGYIRNIYKYALAYGNFGFMGNAIVLALLGEEALVHYMIFTTPLQTGVLTWGVAQLVPVKGDRGSFWKKLANPSFISIVIGAIIGITNTRQYIPAFLLNMMTDLGNCMAPLAMLLTGMVIGDYEIRALVAKPKVYIASLLRLLVLPTVILLLFALLGASEYHLKLILFAYAAPLGLNTVVYPAAYDLDTSTGAAMAVISHSLSVLTIPLMYALLTTFI